MSNQKDGFESKASEVEMMSDEQRGGELQKELDELLNTGTENWPPELREYFKEETKGCSSGGPTFDRSREIVLNYLKSKSNKENEA